MDRAALVIQTWSDFYRWLGSRQPTWGAFTEESGLRLVPHWLAESKEYECQKTPNGAFAFFDRQCIVAPATLAGLNNYGDPPSGFGISHVISFESNLMVTTQPLFPFQ
jgi:hypothetical protein